MRGKRGASPREIGTHTIFIMKRILMIIGVVVLLAVIAAGFTIYTNYRLN
jgi:hypothetical protein